MHGRGDVRKGGSGRQVVGQVKKVGKSRNISTKK